MSARLMIRLAAVPERIPAARGAISRLCEQLDIGDALAGDIRLAVTEACTNCVLHAYGGDCPEQHPTYALEACVEDDSLLVVVRDSGSGVLAPRGAKGGLGFGFGLMRQLASSVDVLARPGRGTSVSMRFALH